MRASPAAVSASPSRLGGLLLFAAVLLVYMPLYQAEYFNYDDPTFIVLNRRLDAGLTWANVRWAFLANLTHFSPSLEYWSPMTALSRLLDVTLWGKDAGAHHATSVVLHGLSATLLFSAMKRLTGRWGVAWWVAAVFAFHPLVAEPVSWLSARKDVVYGLFWNLTLLAYVRYVRRPEGASALKPYLWLQGAFLLAAMSKPMVLTLPCVLLLLDAWPLGRFAGLRQRGFWLSLRDPLVEKLPMFGMSLLLAWLAVYSQRNWGAIAPMESLSLAGRAHNVVIAYWEYLRLVFWPAELSPLHPLRPPAPAWLLTLAGAGLAAISAGALWQWRCRPWLAVGWFWFCGVIFPVSGIMQIGSSRLAERYVYTALPGLALALAWSAVMLLERVPPASRRRAGHALTVVALVQLLAMSARTVHRAWEWRKPERIWTASLGLYPANSSILRQCGLAQWADRKPHAAAINFLEALRLDPRDARALLGLARLIRENGDLPRAAALYQAALEDNSSQTNLVIEYAELLVKLEREDEALQVLHDLLQRVTILPEPWLMQARLQYSRGDREAALESMEQYWSALRAIQTH